MINHRPWIFLLILSPNIGILIFNFRNEPNRNLKLSNFKTDKHHTLKRLQQINFHLTMSLKRELIYIDGKDQTDRIENYKYEGNKCVIVFKNSDKEFNYGKNRAKIVKTAVSKKKHLTFLIT